MNQFILFFCLLFFTAVSAQDLAKDTVNLNEISINKQIKKPKVKKIKVGRNTNANYVSNELFFDQDPVFYLIDSLPKGNIQEISLYFLTTSIDDNFERFKKDKVQKTEFELTLYKVGENNSIGNKVNEEPIIITLEGGDGNTTVLKKTKVDIMSHDFEASRFYICLHKTTETRCKECYYYTPALYKTGNKYHYISNNMKDIYKDVQKCYYCYSLQMEVTTLTQDY